jgi:hypothetical protein
MDDHLMLTKKDRLLTVQGIEPQTPLHEVNATPLEASNDQGCPVDLAKAAVKPRGQILA